MKKSMLIIILRDYDPYTMVESLIFSPLYVDHLYTLALTPQYHYDTYIIHMVISHRTSLSLIAVNTKPSKYISILF